MSELLQDNTCAYAYLCAIFWQHFGNQIMHTVLSTPIGNALYSFALHLTSVLPMFA